MVNVRTALSLLLTCLCAGAAVSAQTPQATPVPSTAMTQQQINEEMLKELRQIRQLLERLTQPQVPPQPTSAKVTSLKGYALGRPDAPLTMVEFTDLQCPFCRQYAMTAFEEIKRNWIDTGQLRYISRDFPLDIHPQALAAARAARCSGEQGKFWDMRVGLMRNANLLTPDYIRGMAATLKLDMPAFTACTASTKYDAEIQAETAEGMRLGITGTPTFVLGPSRPDTVEGPVIVGAMPYSVFDAKLQALLGKQ